MSVEPARHPAPPLRPPRPAVVPDRICGRCGGPVVWFSLLGRRGCANWVCDLRAVLAAQREAMLDPTKEAAVEITAEQVAAVMGLAVEDVRDGLMEAMQKRDAAIRREPARPG